MKIQTTRIRAVLTTLQLLACCMPVTAPAQLLQKMKTQAEQSATRKILNETDKAVSKGIDQAIGSAGSAVTGAPEKGTGQKPVVPEAGGAVPADSSAEGAAPSKPVRSYSRYDFIPGEKVLYANDFAEDPVGELPTGWNSNGSSVVVSLEGIPGKWLRMAQRSVCLTDNEQLFGPDFTVEFDMVLQIDFKGWLPPSFNFGLLASGADAPAANRLLSDPKGDKSFYVEISPLSGAANLVLESYEKYTRYFNSPVRSYDEAALWYGKPVHVAIQGQKERLRIWIDDEKYYDVPKGIAKNGDFNQLFFKLGSSPYKDEQIGVYVSNIKVARGLPDMRHKLVEEGRFSTTGILFDTGSATIRPESAGVLKSVAAVLKAHPDMKIRIVGHTDSVGEEKANLELSGRRAAAVRSALEKEYDLAGTRFETAGKGEQEPVADNSTAEGRAQNRRVEFITY